MITTLKPVLERISQEPYRLLFPAGIVATLIGTGCWTLFSLGLWSGYPRQAHGIMQIESFFPAFVFGFLLTMMPRATGAPYSHWRVVLAMGFMVLTVPILSIYSPVSSHYVFIAMILTFFGFAVTRFRYMKKLPPQFLFLGAGHIFTVPAVIIIVFRENIDFPVWLYSSSVAFVQEGYPLCIILGAGGFLLPRLMGIAPPPESILQKGFTEKKTPGILLTFALVIAAIVISYPLQYGAFGEGYVRAAGGLRSAASGFVLFFVSGLWKLPQLNAFRFWLWVTIWCYWLGFLLPVFFPHSILAWRHLSYVVGMGGMIILVGARVAASHSGMPQLLHTSGRLFAVSMLLLIAAAGARIGADWSSTRFAHFGWAAGLFLAGWVVWSGRFLPLMVKTPPPSGSDSC